MLVEFRVKNFRSIKEEQTLSLMARKTDNELKNNCIRTESDIFLLKTAAIYGANASGKSNIIRAIGEMVSIIGSSANYQPGKELPVEPFRLSNKTLRKPSSFEATFVIDNTRYQYGFTATKERVWEEWLIAYPKGFPQTWFERKYNRNSGKPLIDFGPNFRGEKKRLEARTRENVLFLSVAAQWNHKQIAHIYSWFTQKLRAVPTKEMMGGIDVLAQATEQYLNKFIDLKDGDKHWRQIVIHILKEADLGICDIEMKKADTDKTDILKMLKDDVREGFLKRLKEYPELETSLGHRMESGNEIAYFKFKDESDGTKRFFRLLGPIIETIENGFTVFLDEIESSMHPILSKFIIQLLHSAGDKSNAQLVFATHDTTLLDPQLMRRDQIYLAEKDECGATHLYQLSDYKPRKGEALQKGYLSGRYGAIPMPNLESILESFKKYEKVQGKKGKRSTASRGL